MQLMLNWRKLQNIVDDNTIEVDRGWAGVEQTPGGNFIILLVGKSFGEGTRSPDSRTSYPKQNKNYTQIFKTPFQVTNTARQTRFRTGDAFQNDRKRAMFNHSESLEWAMLWGIPQQIVTTGSNPERSMGGIRNYLSSHVNGSVGAVDSNFFIDTVSPLFDFNAGGAGDQRICFLGNGALNSINKAERNASYTHVHYNGKITFAGLKLLELEIPQGTFYLKTHPLMNTDPVYRNAMFVTNPKGIIVRPMRGRDTKIQKEIQENDADYRKDQWLTETSFELQFERTQGYFGNLS